jgi:hypothetical protein
VESIVVGRSQCCPSTHQIILSAIPWMSLPSWLALSINCAEGNSIRESPRLSDKRSFTLTGTGPTRGAHGENRGRARTGGWFQGFNKQWLSENCLGDLRRRKKPQKPYLRSSCEGTMGMRTIGRRIEQAEEKLRARFVFAPDCICFPDKEPSLFCEELEEEMAAQVKCPLHGERFKPQQFFIYVASWVRENEPAHRQRLSAQHSKAWDASRLPTRLRRAVDDGVKGQAARALAASGLLLHAEPNVGFAFRPSRAAE